MVTGCMGWLLPHAHIVVPHFLFCCLLPRVRRPCCHALLLSSARLSLSLSLSSHSLQKLALHCFLDWQVGKACIDCLTIYLICSLSFYFSYWYIQKLALTPWARSHTATLLSACCRSATRPSHQLEYVFAVYIRNLICCMSYVVCRAPSLLM